MNIIASAPNWAQKSFTSMAARQPVEGTERSPYSEDGFQSVGEAMFGMMMLASFDEVEGQDQAMGQPGVVAQENVTLTFTGQPSPEMGEMEAVMVGSDPETGAEMAYYLDAGGENVGALGLAKMGDTIVAEGAVISPGPDGENQGYLLAGQIS